MSEVLLLAVDGGTGADRAAELLASYRGDPSKISVIVTNIQPRPIAIWPEAAIAAVALEDTLLQAGQQAAAPIVSRLRGCGVRADALVRLGFPAEGIVREAQSQAASLVIVGTRGGGALHGFALGSVAMRVAHASPVPVCVVRPDAKLPAQLGRKVRVMLALDGSEPALRAAKGLAQWHGGWLGELDVQIVHVQQPLTVLETLLPPHHDLVEQWTSAAGKKATQAARELFSSKGVPHHLHLTIGEPAAEILHLAEKTGCEMIVTGTRGLGAAHHAFVGSEALKIAARADRPVILFT